MRYPSFDGYRENKFMMYNLGSNFNGYDYGHVGMMGGWGTGWGSIWFLIMLVGALAWVSVGVLLAIWLFKQINKK